MHSDSNAGSINGRAVECSGLDSGGGGGGVGSGDSVVAGGNGGGGGSGMQTNSAQVTTPSAAFGDEDNSCDSHTRWGKTTDRHEDMDAD